MTKEAALDFGLDINKLVKVRRKDGTYYVYKEEVNESLYKNFMKLEWCFNKKRQRDFEYLSREGMSLTSLDEIIENNGFEAKDDLDVAELAETHLMVQVLEQEINNLPEPDRKLMKLVFHTDLTQRQLADTLGISQGAINIRIKKNKKILREKLIK